MIKNTKEEAPALPGYGSYTVEFDRSFRGITLFLPSRLLQTLDLMVEI